MHRVDRRRAGQGWSPHPSPVKRAIAHTPEQDCPRVHLFLISCPTLLSLSFPELLIPFSLIFLSCSRSRLRRCLQVCFCFFSSWVSSCSSGCPGTSSVDKADVRDSLFFYLCLPSTGIKGRMCHCLARCLQLLICPQALLSVFFKTFTPEA